MASGGIVAAGRYHIKRLLGEGAKKRVFLAHDVQLDRDVAIGVLKAGQLDAVALDRIRREAQAMARLGDHPGIVSVFDIVSESDVPFIVSQYMAGGTLHDWLNGFPNRRPPLDAVLRIGQEICAALSHAHGHGIVHRDVKPTNVWLTSAGDARLGDFGLAVSADHSHLTNEGVMVGTVAYMAPEQALGKPSEPRTDLYAVGALLYELTTGHPPFVGETALSVLSQHIHSTPVPPSRLVPNLPRALESLILSLLAKAPDGRPPTAAHVERMLQACESGVTTVPISTSPASADPVFVGRERELSELRTGVEDALAGQGRLFLISGDPGIGKTRLVEQLTGYARGRGMHVLVGRCYEGEGAPAFWPWVQAIRAHAENRADDLLRREMGSGAAAIARIVPEIAQRFSDLRPDLTADEEQHRFRLFESITHLVKSSAQREPLMIVLDDLHWSDRASLLLLQFVAREIGSARVLIVATHRDAEVDVGEPLADLLPSLRRERVCRRVAIRGLAEREVRELIARLAAVDVPEAFVGGILRGTEGNPFFVEEILRHLIEERILERHEGGWTSRRSPETMRLPESIRAVIDRRLDRLGEACRRLLHIGAVIGREFDAATIEHLADSNRAIVLEVLEEALQSRIVAQAGTGRFAFTHALIREALYEELPRSKRADLHATVAAALEDAHPDLPDAHLPEIARHLLAALPKGNAPRVVDVAVLAGRSAARRLAYEEAAYFFASALDALAMLEARDEARYRELLLLLAEAQRKGGDATSARETYLRVADSARRQTASDDLGHAALGLGALTLAGEWWSDGTPDPPRTALFEEAYAALAANPAMQARVASRLALDHYWTRNPERAELLSHEAVEIARRVGDPSDLATALACRAVVMLGPDRLAEREAMVAEGLALAERSGNRDAVLELKTLELLGHLERGDRSAIDRTIEEYLALADELRGAHHVWYGQVIQVTRAMLDGHIEEAERRANETLALGKRSEDRNAVLFYGAQIITLRTHQGRGEEFETALRGFVSKYPSLVVWRCALAFLFAEAGRKDEAQRHFEDLARDDFAHVPRDAFWSVAMASMTMVALVLDDRARAAKLYELLAPFADLYFGVPPFLPTYGPCALWLGILAGVLRRWDDSVEHLEHAAERCRGMGDEPWIVIVESALSLILVVRGKAADEERARALMERAHEAGRRMGVKTSVQRPVLVGTLLAAAAERGMTERVDRLLGPWMKGARPATANTVAAPVASVPARRPSRVAAWTRSVFIGLFARAIRNASDERLERIFGSRRVQRVLFTLSALSFQEDKAFGFEGEIVYELMRARTRAAADSADSDVWTIRVKGRRARVRRGGAEHPALRVRLGLPAYARISAGLMNPVGAMLEGYVEVEGDMTLAARVVEMFGGVTPAVPKLVFDAEAPAAMPKPPAPSAKPDLKTPSSLEALVQSVEISRPDFASTAAKDGTVTLLFSDVEGFSAMMDRLGDRRAHEVIRDHNAIVRRELRAHGGDEVELMGDGFLLAFKSARRALECAVAMQKRFAEYNRAHADEPLRVRIGIHTGEAIREAHKFFGRTVILAARIAAHARGGEILVSSLFRDLTASDCPLPFGPTRDVELKGLSGRHGICALGWDGRMPEAIAEPPAPPPAPATPPAAAASRNAFRRTGDFWRLEYDGRTATLRDMKGLHYLARLLAEPHRELHVFDLLGVGQGGAPTEKAPDLVRGDLGNAGEVLDPKARAEYRTRLDELQSDLDEAESANDVGRAARAREEMEFLSQELSAAFGLGGRARKAADATERARKAVWSRISGSLARIRKDHPALGAHLANTIRLGTFCEYRPEKLTTWEL